MQAEGERIMPIPMKRKTGYAFAYGSLAIAGIFMLSYLRSGWILHPLPMILYGGLGLTLVASVVGAIILAADGVRLLLRRPVGRWYKIVLDFVPLLLWLIFWML